MDSLRGLGLVEGDGTYTPPSAAELARRLAKARAQAEKRAAQANLLWAKVRPIANTARSPPWLSFRHQAGKRLLDDLPAAKQDHFAPVIGVRIKVFA